MSWRGLIYLPAFGVVALLLYILLGSAGIRWANASREVAFNSAALLHIFCYLLILRKFTLPKLLVNMAFSGLLFLFFLASAMQCAFDDGQFNNCDEEILFILSLINFAIILVLDAPDFRQTLLLATAVFIAVFASIGPYLTAPLKAELSAADLANTCYFQFPTYDRQSEVSRIIATEQLRLGWAIGEHTPRVFKKAGDTLYVWRYSLREFEILYRGIPDSDLDITKLCSI